MTAWLVVGACAGLAVAAAYVVGYVHGREREAAFRCGIGLRRRTG